MLYIVPTPIGNLEDMTYRGVRILKEVELILAEDTRHSRVLLDRYEIKNQVRSFHSYSTEHEIENYIQLLREGKNIALISDAGTPGISDPGYRLIQAVLNAGLELTSLPGASAVTTAIVASGLPSHHFLYLGFLPIKKGRKTLLTSLATSEYSIVIYEAPHRMEKTLAEFETYFGGERRIAVCRELTKQFEEVFRGTIAEAKAHFTQKKPKGEFTLVIAPL